MAIILITGPIAVDIALYKEIIMIMAIDPGQLIFHIKTAMFNTMRRTTQTINRTEAITISMVVKIIVAMTITATIVTITLAVETITNSALTNKF